MAISARTGLTASNTAAATSLTTGSLSLTTGQGVLVAVALANTAASVSSITDTLSNTYTLKSAASNAGNVRTELWAVSCR